MDISDIDLNLLSREELIDIIKNSQIESQKNKIEQLEDEGHFDYSIPDTSLLESFDLSFDISIEDALIEEEEHNNYKEIEHCEKQLKNIENNVKEIKDSVFSINFHDFLSEKLRNIKNHLPVENFPSIKEYIFNQWFELYQTHDLEKNFLKAFLILQNTNNVKEIFDFIKSECESYEEKRKNKYLSETFHIQWFEGYKKLSTIDNKMALDNVETFLNILKSDTDLSEDFRTEFINEMFYFLYKQDYYIENRVLLAGLIFEYADINDNNLKWEPMLKFLNSNIQNSTNHYNQGKVRDVSQVVLDRAENEIFGFLEKRGLLKEWFSIDNDLPEKQDNNSVPKDSPYTFMSNVKENKIKCTFNNFYNQFKDFNNFKEYLLIKREKFIIQNQLDMHKEDTDLRKTKRL